MVAISPGSTLECAMVLASDLFRYSLLRGADAADPDVQPIHIASSRVTGRVTHHVEAAVRWLHTVDLGTTTTADAAAFAGSLEQVDRELLQNNVALLSRDAYSAFGRLLDAPGQERRIAFVDSTSALIAAGLLVDVAAGPSTTSQSLSEWMVKHPVAFPPVSGRRPHHALVRAPGFLNHFVVKEELLGYKLGEIEDIKNYLRGEVKLHTLRHLNVSEDEYVAETEETVARTEEAATQERSNLKAAAQETANSTLGVDARVKTDGTYGPTHVSTDVGFQYSSSSSEARQTAAEFSTDVLNRSIEEERSRKLTRSTTRRRVEIEENREHKVDNTAAAAHTIGIYRWVESVWRATTYDVGQRLVLEMVIPEPGGFFRGGTGGAEPSGLPPEPVPPDEKLFGELSRTEPEAAGTAAKWARNLGAQGIKAPPALHTVASFPFASEKFEDKPASHVARLLVSDVKVPVGYVCRSVVVQVTTMGSMNTEGQADIVVDFPGHKTEFFLNDKVAGNPNPIQFVGGTGIPGRYHPDIRTFAWSSRHEGGFGSESSVAVSIFTEDKRGVSGFVELQCDVTDATYDQWRLDTVQTLQAAYLSRKAEWDAAKLSLTFEPPAPRPDPDIDAICRHLCIENLLGKLPPSPTPGPLGWPIPDSRSEADQELILFMEQAFEWSNLQYVMYPYYWGDPTRWPSLLAADHADPHVRELLRSGAVRFVIPVGLDYAAAVLFFLKTGVPWSAGPAPAPGDPGYLAISQEIIAARTRKSDEWKVVSTDDFCLPTALTILQETGVLPEPDGEEV